MIGLISLAIFSLFFELSSSPYRTIFTTSFKGQISSSMFINSLIGIERKLNLGRERRYINTVFSFKIKSNVGVSGIFDETLVNVNNRYCDSRGGMLESWLNFKGLTSKLYFETRRYEGDSAFFRSGYGIILYRNYRLRNLIGNIRSEYRKFSLYKKISTVFRGSNKDVIDGIQYEFNLHFKKQTLPMALVLLDTRIASEVHGRLSFLRDNRAIQFNLDYKDMRSAKVVSMNFNQMKVGFLWNMDFFKRENVSASGSGYVRYFFKNFKGDGKEKANNYGFSWGLSYRKWLALETSLYIKRFDYFSLIPLDRDERSGSISLSVKRYEFVFERLDINYINWQYVSNSKTVKRFTISTGDNVFKIGDITAKYSGRLFASISYPIYADDMGFYQRHWENKIMCEIKDSMLFASLSIRYKQFGKFKTDSIYAPFSEVEYSLSNRFRLIAVKKKRAFIKEYLNISFKYRIREWKLGLQLETDNYNLELGIGSLMERRKTYMEFSGWI